MNLGLSCRKFQIPMIVSSLVCCAILYLTFRSPSSLQGRMGRKGFPGKIGPEGLKVRKDSLIFFIIIK